ncbi:disease resistance protein RPV1-like isoform X2 [Bidens hawaiensis]|uniref:disease resistance protein RPV1-like isoform X2 n=1 Tax=Bidens hawaiensis TaxID=980011 RepID=UPI0040496E6A
MASSSSSSTSRYDVFISFHDDTRFSFTDHLYEALTGSGIRTFRPDPTQHLNPNIETSITLSRASVVVLSKNYADSVSCLEQLRLIMERRKGFYHIVIPVFYHVHPSDFRKEQSVNDLKVFRKAEKEDKLERWKVALMEVASLCDEAVSGPETKFIADIVNTIGNKLGLKLVSSPPHLTGMDTRAEDINLWLKNKHDDQVLTICGLAGSGKTTLAKYIYDSNMLKFESSSFLEDIGKICEQTYGLCALQEQLLSDILEDKRKELDVTSYKSQIEKALQNKRVLLVLDDVDKTEQIEALLGMEKINTESKIIITSRLQDIKTWFESRYRRYKEHKLELLNEHESLALLSWHAFGSKIPNEGFKELALKAAQYCKGNPLALKLLGSLFVNAKDSRKRNNIEYWMSTLNLLESKPDYRIEGILRMSYDNLPFITYRELFLHIACFFIGEDEDYVVKILEPDYCATAGIVTLINRCLLTVSQSKKLMMHGLFIEMARRMVLDESPANPAKRSRVWSNEDSYTLLRKGIGSETIEGLALDMRMVNEEKHNMPMAFDADSLAKMDNLKLLQLNYVELSGSYDDFPEDLRWLCWHGFPLRTLPSELFMGNLVAIDMSYSKLEVFEPPMVIRPLKILNFKDSHSLVQIHNISRLPNLDTLILWNCYSLVRVSETFADLKTLSLLNLTGCENLFKDSNFSQHPSLTFPFPHSLQRLLVESCNLELNDHLLNFKHHSVLQYLNLSSNMFDILPDYNQLKNLRVLDLSFCSKLKCIECLPNTLEELFITCCKSLENITFQSPRFKLKEFDYQGCNSLLEIEGLLKLVPILKLDESFLGHMNWLKEYQDHEVCLVGDSHLTKGRSQRIQILYEFGITSTFFPDIKDPNLTCEYTSKSSSLSFEVPTDDNINNHKLKGLNIIFKYILFGDEKDTWPIFAKISNITKCCEWIYNPMVIGSPGLGEVAIWLSYWSMENLLDVGDKVNVSIIVENGLDVVECGASLVYDDEVENDAPQNNRKWDEIIVGDLSAFQLSKETYYLCRRDFFKSMEVDGPTPSWFRDSVGYKFDYTEIRGWRKTGRVGKLQL